MARRKPGVSAAAARPACLSGAFDSLTPELLDRVLQLADNQTLLSTAPLVCKRFNRAVSSSPNLWKDVALELLLQDGTRQRLDTFKRWLVPRAASVRNFTFRLLAVLVPSEEAQEIGEQVFAALEEALALLAPTLRSLSVDWAESALVLNVGEWAAQMKELKTLLVAADRIDVTAALGDMTALQTLGLRASSGHVALERCPALPPNLDCLQVTLRTPLPPCFSTLTTLRHASLSDSRLTHSLAPLARNTRLEYVALNTCCLSRPPGELAALKHLQALYLDGNDFSSSASELSPLVEALPLLSVLAISNCKIREVPPGLMQSASLRALYLEANALTQLPEGPALRNLLVASVDWAPLLDNTGWLRAAPRLRHLYICRPPTAQWEWTAAGAADLTDTVISSQVDAAVAAKGACLVSAAQCHQALRQLTFVQYSEAQRANKARYTNVTLALGRLCSWVEVDAIEEHDFFAWGTDEVKEAEEEETAGGGHEAAAGPRADSI